MLIKQTTISISSIESIVYCLELRRVGPTVFEDRKTKHITILHFIAVLFVPSTSCFALLRLMARTA